MNLYELPRIHRLHLVNETSLNRLNLLTYFRPELSLSGYRGIRRPAVAKSHFNLA